MCPASPPGPFSNRVVTIQLEQDDPALAEALERPSPASAAEIAKRCARLMSRYKSGAPEHALLEGHRGWCLSIEEGASESQLEEAVALMERAAAVLTSGRKSDWVAAQRKLGEALLKLESGDQQENGLRALSAFDQIVSHLEGVSFEDWANTWLGYVRARLRAYPDEDHANSRKTLELVIARGLQFLGESSFVQAAKALLNEIRAAEEEALAPPEDPLQQLIVRFNAEDTILP
jgi:hypothetical protein